VSQRRSRHQRRMVWVLGGRIAGSGWVKKASTTASPSW
jgi:hypothetical protein